MHNLTAPIRTHYGLTFAGLRVEYVRYSSRAHYVQAHTLRGRIGFVLSLHTRILIIDGPHRVHVFQPGHGHQSAHRAAIDL